jgi:hypothetical protein
MTATQMHTWAAYKATVATSEDAATCTAQLMAATQHSEAGARAIDSSNTS